MLITRLRNWSLEPREMSRERADPELVYARTDYVRICQLRLVRAGRWGTRTGIRTIAGLHIGPLTSLR